MMQSYLKDLANQLSLVLLGHAYVGSSTAPETFLIDQLLDFFDGWTVGDYDYEELKGAFDAHVPTFDLPLYIVKLQERGILSR